jgi:hypothetical protein
MLSSNIIIVTIILITNINSLIIGYLLGRLTTNNGVNINNKSFFSKLKDEKFLNSVISIDDKKFVTDIKTDGLERKFETLGDIKTTKDNISNSVDKLKNLKR